MKDAKGHGSNPRGAHAEGVDQIGKTQTMAVDKIHPTENLFLGKDGPVAVPAQFRNLQDPHHIELHDRGAQAQVDQIRSAIRAGQEVSPINVKSNGDIVDGHHRFEAFKQEGVKQIQVRVVS